MGEVIRKDAAADEIMQDVNTTLANAVAQAGPVKKTAEEKLAPLAALFLSVLTSLAAAVKAYAPFRSALNVEDDKADRLLGKIHDDLWNALGRPANDPSLAVLFPGGASFYAEGSNSEQPDRMNVLSELLLAGLHPKLAKDTAKMAAGEIAEAAKSYRAALEAARAPRAKVDLFGRVKTALGKFGQMELQNLKRRFKSEGLTEAQIHAIIPDRPRPTPPPPDEKK